MGITKRFLAASIPAAVLLLTPATCLAGSGADYLANVLLPSLLSEVLVAFWGVAAAFVLYYAIRLVLEAHKDEAMKDISNAFIYVVTGFVIIALAGAFASAFGIGTLSSDAVSDITPLSLELGITSVADFIIKVSAGLFILIIVITGMKMVASQGDSANFDKARKILVANCLGVVLMLTAWFIVHAVSDVAPGILITEMRGLALWMLTLIGYICVIALIVAGILLIVSIDESFRDRAKRMVIGILISLLILTICYSVILIFIPTTNTVPSLT